MYSKLQCANKLAPTVKYSLSQNWKKRFSQKSVKISPLKWLVTYYYNNNTHKESETLSPLPGFKRIKEILICNGYILHYAEIGASFQQ